MAVYCVAMTQRILGGTDGFRGEAELDNPSMGVMNETTVANLSAALVAYQIDRGVEGPIVVARDTRPSSERLARAAVAGALSRGGELIDLGVAPTPMAQFMADKVKASATVVITASHNPHTDNGWKGMLGSDKPSKQESRDISELAWDMSATSPAVITADGIQSEKSRAYEAHYKDSIVNDIQERLGERPLDGKIVVIDGAYGAAQRVTPAVFRALGARVEEFSCDGTGYINEGCGAADLSGLKSFLYDRPDLVGDPNFLGAIANDGDADRMMAIGVVYQNGEPSLVEVDGNHAMWLLADGAGIVGTDYTNSGVVRQLRHEGFQFEYCENGDSNVTSALRARQLAGERWYRGGEFTGHFVDLDWLSSGDGIRTGALFASTAAARGMNFGDVFRSLPLWHQEMAKVRISDTPHDLILNNEGYLQALADSEAQLGDEGRLLLRPSGTEPVFRVWGESTQPEILDAAVARLSGIVECIVRAGQSRQSRHL